MGFIARQPNGKYCRHSGVVDCITEYNMTREDYIAMNKEKGVSEEESIDVLEHYLQPFEMIKEEFMPRNMTKKEFKQILKEMEEN